jgi:hypothetical protein
MKRIVFVLSMLLVLLIAVSASADTFPFQLTIPNDDLSPYPAPYADVLVNLTSSTTADVTFTGDTSGGFSYLLGAAHAADLNVNATSFTATGFAWTGGNTPAFTPDYFPNNSVSQFGKLNLQIDNFDGFNDAVTQLSFTLTNTQAGGSWANAANVLTPDADGFLAAAHIFVVNSQTGANPATGYAGNGTPIPEPATMLLLGSGLIGLAGFARKRFKK